MGGRTEGNSRGTGWKILIGLSVLCAALVFLGGFLHRHALDSAIADRQAKSVAFVNAKVADAIHGVDLAKPLKDADAARLTKKLDVPAGTDVRLFSIAGVPVYSSPGSGSFPADAEGIQAAAAGDQGRVVDGADLRVYTPVRSHGQKPVATAAVISNYTQLRKEASGPLDAVRLPLVGLGIVFLIAGLLLMLQATKGGSTKKTTSPSVNATKAARAETLSQVDRRVTGFEPVAVTTAAQDAPAGVEQVAPERETEEEVTAPKARFAIRRGPKKDASQDEATEAPMKAKRSLFGRKGDAIEDETLAAPLAGKAASALDREVAIRQALEDQLEQLRTRIQRQDAETNDATEALLAQLEAANRRAEEAEAGAKGVGATPMTPPAPAAVSPDAEARIQQMERELAGARSITADAIARADALQRQVDETAAAPEPASDPGTAARLEEAVTQLADAQQRASAAEQRAASVESVRAELEVRVAQLGTKASDLEQRATELETSLNEANAGGDAVRAEIATLTAALAAANGRVDELEAAPAPAIGNDEKDKTEIARLRGELANHMERAQAAEERVTTLEADVLAAESGVRALPVHDERSASDETFGPGSVEVFPAEALATTPEPESQFMRSEVASPADGPRDADIEPSTTQTVPQPETSEGVAERAEAREPEPARTSESQLVPEPEPEPEPLFMSGEAASLAHGPTDADPIVAPATQADPRADTPEGVVHRVASESSEPEFARTSEPEFARTSEPEFARTSEPEPEPAPAPAAPTVAWRAPSPTVSETVASTNGDGVPPAPSDDTRYDDIWTAAFAPPQQVNVNHHDPEPQAAGPQAVEPQATEAQPVEPQAAEPQGGEPRQMNEPSAPEPTAESAADPASEPSAEDRPAPPEDEVSVEDDMWSLRARLAEAAARKKPPPRAIS